MAKCSSQQDCYRQALEIQNSAGNTSLYSPYLFPYTGTSQTLNVTVAIIIFKLLTLDNDKTLTMSMEIDLSWQDPNYPGDWSALPNNTQLYTDSSLVWTMNMYLINPAGSNLYLRPDNLIFLFPTPDGSSGALVQENIIGEFSSACDSMNLINYPFDSQTCTMLVEYGDSTNLQNVQFNCPTSIIMSSTPDDDEWRITNVSCSNASNELDGGIYVGVGITFSFTRKSFYYLLFLILPIVLLQSIGILTVLLPSDRGEKVVLGATLVMSMYVLITAITIQVPQVEADETPRVVIALLIGTCMTAVALLEAVVVQTLRIVAFDLPEDVHHMADPAFWRRRLASKCNCFSNTERETDNDKGDVYVVANGRLGPSDSSTDRELHHSAASVESAHSFGSSGANFNWFEENRGFDDSRTQTTTDSFAPLAEPSSPQSVLLNCLLEDCKEKRRRRHIKAVWRKIEYVLNFLTLLAYGALLGYYFGAFIYAVD